MSCDFCLNKEKCGGSNKINTNDNYIMSQKQAVESKNEQACSGCNGEVMESLDHRTLPKVTGGFINVTQKCNLKCKYCFVVQQPTEMTFQVAKDAADFYASNASLRGTMPSIVFFGGEPLLRWDDIIVPLVIYIRDRYNKFDLSITSNCVLMDRDKLEFMKKHNVGLLFSIDGDKKTQDLNRPFHNGEGSFDILEDKIPLILEYYPTMTFRATVDHDNVYDMLDNFNFAVEKGYTNIFMIPNIFSEWSKEEKAELEVQLEKIADRVIELLRQEKRVDFNPFNDTFPKIKQLDNMKGENAFRDAGKNFPGFGRCGIGASGFASVGATGKLYSCQEMTENPEVGDKFCIGNIYDGTDDEKRWQIINQFDPRNVRRSDDKTCMSCPLNPVCDGGCNINNYFANGDLNIMSSLICDYYIYLFEQSMRIINVMSEEKNELFKDIFLNR